MRRHAATALALAGLSAAAAAPAEGAIRFERCDDGSGEECGSVLVPLDRIGGADGRVRLHVRRVEARGARRGVLFAFAGGPGQASALFAGSFAQDLGRRHDIVAFDPRGAGRSAPLHCDPSVGALADLGSLSRRAAACARRIGPRRAFHTTRDQVDDVESVRRALGVSRISLAGVSYGTKVALAYAARYPGRVDRMVLDSPVRLDTDLLYRESFRATPRVLRATCGDGRCRAVTPDPGADLAAVTAAMRLGPLTGTVVDARGRPRAARLGRVELFFLLTDGDFDDALRARLPAALRGAAAGDPAELLRLAARPSPEDEDDGSFSAGLYAATTCEDGPLPWDRTTPVGERLAQARARAVALPAAAFAPFDAQTALEADFVRLCLRWPSARRARPIGGTTRPPAPALLISGEGDVRTPLEGAQGIAASLPRARVTVVRGVGHDVMSRSECATRGAQAFLLGGGAPALCVERTAPVLPLPPRSLTEVRASAPRLDERRARTLNAARDTLADALRAHEDLAGGSGPQGGLRGGRVTETLAGLRLRGVVYVPGVEVSGEWDSGGESFTGTVTGAGVAPGRVTLEADGSARGSLDGEAFRSRVPRF